MHVHRKIYGYSNHQLNQGTQSNTYFYYILYFSYTILSRDADEWIFAFYGYGQHAEVYQPLADQLKSTHNVVVIDLPYQQINTSLEIEEFTFFIRHLIALYQIKKISSISYSLGSRLNLIMAQNFPGLVSKMILVAPDGIVIRFWNRIATRTWMGKNIFKLFVAHPHLFLNLIHFFFRCGLMKKSMYAFAKWHMRDQPSRLKVYHAWMNLKNFVPQLQTIQQNCSTGQMSITAFFGEHDSVINRSCMKRLQKNIPSAKIVVLNKGHNLLDEQLFEDIAALLLC